MVLSASWWYRTRQSITQQKPTTATINNEAKQQQNKKIKEIGEKKLEKKGGNKYRNNKSKIGKCKKEEKGSQISWIGMAPIWAPNSGTWRFFPVNLPGELDPDNHCVLLSFTWQNNGSIRLFNKYFALAFIAIQQSSTWHWQQNTLLLKPTCYSLLLSCLISSRSFQTANDSNSKREKKILTITLMAIQQSSNLGSLKPVETISIIPRFFFFFGSSRNLLDLTVRSTTVNQPSRKVNVWCI